MKQIQDDSIEVKNFANEEVIPDSSDVETTSPKENVRPR